MAEPKKPKRPYYGGGRKAKGVIVRGATGYSARFWVGEGDERRRVTKNLGTDSLPVAKKKLARLLAEEDPASVDTAAPETFEEAATRIFEERDTVSVAEERSRLKRYAYPVIGSKRVTKIETRHVNEVLREAKAAGRSKGTVQHLKQDISNVLAALKNEGAIKLNPAEDSELPKYRDTVKKERAVLTDDELATYLAWEHPDKRHRGAVLERQIMSVVARCFGGVRTGDEHSIRWESFDIEGGRFAWGYAPRQKTKRPQRLAVPEYLRPFLKLWWQLAGKPETGLVFPVRRGERAGQQRKSSSHAHDFRRDLQRAFGLKVPRWVERTRTNGRKLTEVKWEPAAKKEWARPMTRRERELFEETAETLPVDFHSWRRAYNQALAEAGVTLQQAQGLAGHASLDAHALYLASAETTRHMPAGALPSAKQLAGASAFASEKGSGWRDLNPQQPAPKAGPLPG
jgi:integrase